jgi:hypothetical protein
MTVPFAGHSKIGCGDVLRRNGCEKMFAGHGAMLHGRDSIK